MSEQKIITLDEGQVFNGEKGWKLARIIGTTYRLVGPDANYVAVYTVIAEREDTMADPGPKGEE